MQTKQHCTGFTLRIEKSSALQFITLQIEETSNLCVIYSKKGAWRLAFSVQKAESTVYNPEFRIQSL